MLAKARSKRRRKEKPKKVGSAQKGTAYYYIINKYINGRDDRDHNQDRGSHHTR